MDTTIQSCLRGLVSVQIRRSNGYNRPVRSTWNQPHNVPLVYQLDSQLYTIIVTLGMIWTFTWLFLFWAIIVLTVTISSENTYSDGQRRVQTRLKNCISARDNIECSIFLMSVQDIKKKECKSHYDKLLYITQSLIVAHINKSTNFQQLSCKMLQLTKTSILTVSVCGTVIS